MNVMLLLNLVINIYHNILFWNTKVTFLFKYELKFEKSISFDIHIGNYYVKVT